MTQENKLDINNQEQNKGKLTHFNEAGEAHMVDVHAKDDTYRVAKACGTIKVNGAVYRAVSTGTAKKGDVLAVMRNGHMNCSGLSRESSYFFFLLDRKSVV